jgi:hypothetical protein
MNIFLFTRILKLNDVSNLSKEKGSVFRAGERSARSVLGSRIEIQLAAKFDTKSLAKPSRRTRFHADTMFLVRMDGRGSVLLQQEKPRIEDERIGGFFRGIHLHRNQSISLNDYLAGQAH